MTFDEMQKVLQEMRIRQEYINNLQMKTDEKLKKLTEDIQDLLMRSDIEYPPIGDRQ
jgi:hypothetical protein